MAQPIFKVITNYSVGTTPVLIGPQGDNANHSRQGISVYNNAGGTVYLGSNAQATSTSGYPVPTGVEFTDDVSADNWYAVAASGTVDLRVIVFYGGG